MNRSTTFRLVVLAGLALSGLLFVQFVRLNTASQTRHRSVADKTNLALRRTAHLLLLESGDSTTRIAPVRQSATGVWVIRLERSFDYDRLPALLQASFDLHEIQENYDVAVLDCSDGILHLGYNRLDVGTKNEVACGGREQGSGCYDLQISFPDQQPASGSASAGWWLLGGFMLAGLSFAAYQRAFRPLPSLAPPVSLAPEDTGKIALGHSSLEVANLTLHCPGKVHHTLTYREAKLLHLFATHANQLLERDFILKSVWEDEGIIVGRSVDVFVSRLRKLLRDDASVRIVTVHGVGYRLEAHHSE